MHRPEIESSAVCGCFSCLSVFGPSEIVEWLAERGSETAFCPKCGIDAVIGSASGFDVTDAEFLLALNAAKFDMVIPVNTP
jgi:hypothetical protein